MQHQRIRNRRICVVAVAVASATAGWALGRDQKGRHPVSAESAGTVIPSSVNAAAPRHAGQFGSADKPAEPIVRLPQPTCNATEAAPEAVDVAGLERTLTDGSESERYTAFIRALQSGIDLSPELLRAVFDTDESETMRLLAFGTYVDARSGHPAEVRAMLERGIYDESSALREEAQRRLAE